MSKWIAFCKDKQIDALEKQENFENLNSFSAQSNFFWNPKGVKQQQHNIVNAMQIEFITFGLFYKLQNREMLVIRSSIIIF